MPNPSPAGSATLIYTQYVGDPMNLEQIETLVPVSIDGDSYTFTLPVGQLLCFDQPEVAALSGIA